MNKSTLITNLDLKEENKNVHFVNLVNQLQENKTTNKNKINEINLNLKKLTKFKYHESNPIFETFTTHMK